jgi:uncharacterized repeat protein (TIGR03803 family)
MRNSRIAISASVLVLFVGAAFCSEAAFAATSGIKLLTLHTFVGSDGVNPAGPLIMYKHRYYMVLQGGVDNDGLIVSINSRGDFRVLHGFTGAGDGAIPYDIILHDDALYGTTSEGGSYGYGTYFKVPLGVDENWVGKLKTIRSYTESEASSVGEPFFFVGDEMVGYGTEFYGNIFTLSGNGTASELYGFSFPNAFPVGILLGNDGNYYGATFGWLPSGTIWELTPGGTLTILHTFAGPDGDGPRAEPVLASDGSLYGTTEFGGANGDGVVYRLTADGEFSVLYSFGGGDDGEYPIARLTLGTDGNLYGSTSSGGSSSCGTLFEISTTGEFRTLYAFSGQDGCEPHAPVTETERGNFMGTTAYGGAANVGTVFKLITH